MKSVSVDYRNVEIQDTIRAVDEFVQRYARNMDNFKIDRILPCGSMAEQTFHSWKR